ncbi:MAG TPA: zf-HC2 domain-containing protein [Terriglobales bacterium]|nr:zf-HC2 domain-containing protein [Terriglobales bacterium]
MDHAEAGRLMMVERYLLGELSPNEQEAFEEHFFACEECAFDVRTEAAFLDHSKVVLLSPLQEQRAEKAQKQRGRWGALLRPAVLLPIVLALLLSYESLVKVPKTERLAAEAESPQILPTLSLISVTTRGGEQASLTVRKGEPFLLFVDIPTDNRFVSYSAHMFDPSGHEVWSLPVTTEAARDTVSIQIPGQQNSGTYSLLVRGVGNDGHTSDVGRFPFELRLTR